MDELKPPSTFAKLARAAIGAGLACVALALAALHLLPDAQWESVVILTPFALGLALVVLGAVCNLGWIWRKVRQRRFLSGLNMWAMVLLALVILTVSNVIVVKTPETESWYLDCTADRLFTLSEKSRNVLNGLKEDVRITVVAGSGTVSFEGQGEVSIGKRVADVVGVYRAASSRIRTETMDFYREPLRVEQTAQRIGERIRPDTIVLECAGRSRIVPYFDLVRTDGFTPTFLGEPKITSAVLALSEPRQSNVYFVVGHGETSIEPSEEASLSKFAGALRADNCRVETANLLGLGRIPEACDLLVVAGAAAAFEQTETDMIYDYLAQGGRLLVLVRPIAVGGRMDGLDALLGEFNIGVDDRRIAIEVYRNVPDLRVVVQDFDLKHPITEGFKNRHCLLPKASPVGPLLGAEGAAGLASPYHVTVLCRSSERSWGESVLASQVGYDERTDAPGPLPLAAAAAPRVRAEGATEDGMRIVVIGSTSAATDDAFEAYAINSDLLTNSVAWLLNTERKLGIQPQPARQRRLSQDETAWKIVFAITVLGMPLAAAAAGLGVWAVRRRG